MLEAYHWALWAQAQRTGDGVLRPLGYPAQVPWYTQPRWGQVTTDGHLASPPDDRDHALAEQIEAGVRVLQDAQPLGAVLLRQYWGAAPGLPVRRRERLARLARLEISRSKTYRLVARYERWVARWVEHRQIQQTPEEKAHARD